MTTSRRSFLKTSTALACGALASSWTTRASAFQGEGLVTPTTAQQRWQDAEIGVIFHLDLSVLAGEHTRNNGAQKTYDPKVYNPKELDTDQWLEVAKGIGAKYAVFTATHFNGFMQWQSDLYPYGCKQASWRDGRGDVVADFVASCQKANIPHGLYLSTHRNCYQTVWGHWVDWGKGHGTEKQKAFNRTAEAMTEELCTRYGKLFQIWFDAGVKTPEEGGPDVEPIFAKHQPDSVFYHSIARSDHRWIGNEAGQAGHPCWATMPIQTKDRIAWKEQWNSGNPDGPVWSPGMGSIVLRGWRRHEWFWRPGMEDALFSVDQLMDKYYSTVGRNCNMLVGLVVDNRGLVPEADLKRAKEFGDELRRRFSTHIAETNGEGESVTLKLPQPAKVGHVVIMEDIAHGERIQEYDVEGLLPGGNWEVLCRGVSVGHKRIEKIPAKEMAAVRLNVKKSKRRPIIRQLAVYA